MIKLINREYARLQIAMHQIRKTYGITNAQANRHHSCGQGFLDKAFGSMCMTQ